MAKARPSRSRPLMLRFLPGLAHALKRVRRRRSLRVRTSVAMAKSGPSRPRLLTLRLLSALANALVETRSPAQKSACKDLERNGQSPAITLKATYAPVSNRAGSRSADFSEKCYGYYVN